MTNYIYGLYDPRNQNLRYIGKTNNVRKRFHGHMHENLNTHKSNWIANLKRNGLNPILKIIEEIQDDGDDEKWQQREIYWIQKSLDDGHALTNLDSGGNSGYTKSEETKKKISVSNTGKKRSEETKRRISVAKSNPSDETRLRISVAKTGSKQSQETKDKRADKLKGQKRSDETKSLLSIKRKETAARKRLENPTPPKVYKGHKNRPPISDETRQKLRDSHKGKKQSPETIAKRFANRIGVPRSEGTKLKISLGHLGKPKKRKTTTI